MRLEDIKDAAKLPAMQRRSLPEQRLCVPNADVTKAEKPWPIAAPQFL